MRFRLFAFLLLMPIFIQASNSTGGAAAKGCDVDCHSLLYDSGFRVVNNTQDHLNFMLRTASSFGSVVIPPGSSHSFVILNCHGGVINAQTNNKSTGFYTFDFLKFQDGPHRGCRYPYGGIVYSRDSKGCLQAKPLYYGAIGGAVWRTIKQRTFDIDL